MSYLPFALFAYFLNCISVLTDKFLLSKSIPNPLLYVFNISLISLLVFVLLPFTHIPNPAALVYGSASTLLWTMGAYFMFRALKIGQAARVIPVIGTMIPVILTLVSFYSGTISGDELWAVSILLFGLIFLVLPYLRGRVLKEELLLEVVSGLFYANSYLLLKWAYLQADFLSVMVYSRVILVPILLIIVFVPVLKKLVLSSQKQADEPKFRVWSKIGLLFFLGQAAGGFSGLFLNFAISMASPAIVNSLQGTQYVFLFIFSIILGRFFPKIFGEKFSFLNILGKILGIMLIALGLFMLSGAEEVVKIPNLGISYSPRYASGLGLNSKSAFPEIVERLRVKNVRLPIYWDEVEKKRGVYDFSDVDYYLSQTKARKINVVLTVGYKQPRWPECFFPAWVNDLTNAQKDEAILKLVQTEVEHFKKNDSIKVWQVENEPFLDFGNCEKPSAQTLERLKKEVALVKSMDSRPVLITDSGELGLWYNAMNNGDIFGTTLYRTVWSQLLGMVDYPMPPTFYKLKARFVQMLTGKKNPHFIVSELQAEPWIPGEKGMKEVSFSDLMSYFPPGKMTKNVEYAHKTGFESTYLWGAEWWLWMETKGHPDYMNEAQKIFSPQLDPK